VVFVGLMTQWSGNLFVRTFSSNFYDVQAQSFLHGRITMPKSVLSVESFTVHGRTSMYFGPFLAVLRMPLMAVAPSLSGRTTQCSMVLAFILVMVASLSLFGSLWELGGGAPWPRHPVVPACWALLCGGGSVALYLGGYPSIYSETELWSAALALVTLRCGLAVLRSPSLRSVTSCGGAALLTVATRSAVGLGSLALLGMLAVVLWLSTLERSPRCHSVMMSLLPQRSSPERRRLGVVLGLWSGGIVALSIAVNEAKFGTAFSVPVRSQGVATDGLSPTYTAFVQHHSSFTELAALPSTLWWYFQPFALHFSSLFPFVNFPATIHVLNPGAFEGLNPSSSIPSSMPLLFVLALVGCGGLIVRRRAAAVDDGASFRSRAAVVLVAAAASMVGMLTYPGIAHRHLGDALPVLIAAGAIGGVVVHRRLHAASPLRRRVLAACGVLLLAVSVWINAGLGILDQQVVAGYQAGTGSLVSFQQFRHRLHQGMFASPEPEVGVGSAPASPLVGALWADTQCGVLHEWTGTRWVTIERGRAGGTVAYRGSVAQLPSDAFVVLLSGERPGGVPFLVGLQGQSRGTARPEIVMVRRGALVVIARGRSLRADGVHRFVATLAGSSSQQSFPVASLAVDNSVVVQSFAIPRHLEHGSAGSVPSAAPPGVLGAAALSTLVLLPSRTTTPLCSSIVQDQPNH